MQHFYFNLHEMCMYVFKGQVRFLGCAERGICVYGTILTYDNVQCV